MKLPRNIDLWIGEYIKQRTQSFIRTYPKNTPLHFMFCFADHFEPQAAKPTLTVEKERVKYWIDNYPTMALQFEDSDGRNPIHSFFYPEEEYRKEHLDNLGMLCKKGFGEVEVHLHHDHDTEAGFRAKLTNFLNTLHKEHGMLGVSKIDRKPKYAFIHGNWALNNSRPDGRWCGVDNEIDILLETGCYADLTMPSAPSDTQTNKINSIYYSAPFKDEPKCHNTGSNIFTGMSEQNRLMMIQGPLMLNWGTIKSPNLPPKIENGEFDYTNLPNDKRISLWKKAHIKVQGKDNWVFIKIHTHGASFENAVPILCEGSIAMHKSLQKCCNDGKQNKLHYVSAREMYNIIKAAQNNEQGNPNDYRDYIIDKPAVLG